MKKLEKALIAIVLAATVFMTGIAVLTSAQENSNQNNSNSGNRNRRSNMNANVNANMNSNMDSQMMKNANSGSMTDMMSDMLDANFAMAAAKGGEAEIQMANLALQRSQNSDVQKFARQMITDHTTAGEKLEKVAMQKNITLDKSLTAEQQEMLSKLQQATAADFDMMYLQMGGVTAHEKMEMRFQNQIKNGTDAEIKNFAEDVLPTVQKHLKMAREMTGNGMNMTDKMKMDGNMNSNRGNSNTNDNR